jgi:hypothetical protein
MENPTRHQMFKRGLEKYVDDTWPGGLQGYARYIKRTQPPIISLAGRRVPGWLWRTLRTEYRAAGKAPGWFWWVHDPSGGAGE